MRLRFLLPAALAALVLTACQPSASASPSAPGPSSGAFPSGPLPSLVGDADLEATLPTSAGDITFFTVSMSGPDFMSDEVQPQFLEFLDRLGADLDDVSVAVAIGSNSDGTQTASIFAFQVAGEDAESLVAEFQAAGAQGGEPLEWHEERIADKTVQVAEPTEAFPTPVALYAVGDVLYFATSSSDQALEEIINQLP